MQKIEIIALLTDSKKIIERLQRRGVVELCNIDDERVVKLNTSNSISLFEKHKARIQQAMDILDLHAPAKKGILASFEGRRSIEKHAFGERAATLEKTLLAATEILAHEKSVTELKAVNSRLTVQSDNLASWVNLDVPTSFKGTQTTACFIGSVSGMKNEQDLAELLPETHIEIISSSKQQTNISVICMRDNEKETYSALQDLGFIPVPEVIDVAPAVQIEKNKTETQNNLKEIEKLWQNVVDFAPMRDDFEFMVDYLQIRCDKYQALNQIAVTNATFIITGFIPEKYAEALTRELEKRFTVAISIYPPEQDEETPVLLQNSKFSAPVEGITEMYALPNKRDLDPTSVMSFFYYLFFGMMLSDAGYGIIMVLGTWLALKKLNLETKIRKTLTMFMYCGVSTIFWGALFGSWFGDIVQVVAREYFGKEIKSIALWFQPLDDPMKLLLFSFGLGICHLFLGLGANMYKLWHQGKKWDAVCEVVPVYITVLGVAPVAASILTTVPPILSTIGGYMAIVGVVLIILTAGRTSKSFIARIFGGLYGLYNIATGYLSDILSYSRLLALGLATGSIASVINLIGTMPQNMVIKTIMLVVVFIVGHIANMAINLLGAYVHTDRLQFVELFSKFYEGGGRPFSPLTVNTKYVKFKEENIND